MRRVIVVSLCFCSILLFCLTGCGKQEQNNAIGKLDSELTYVEDLIFKIANKHAKGEYLEEEEINWKWIKDDVSKMNSCWANLVLDLTNVNVQNQDIMEFSNALNDLLISISEKNQIEVIEQLNQMYEKVVIFKEAYSENKNQIQKNKIKSGVLGVYSLVNQKDWATARIQIDRVIENYKGLMNDIHYAEENAYSLNKIYVLLEEYKNTIPTQNYDLVRMKYIVTVENL